MPTPEFSDLDAQNLVAMAQNAPLRNLKEAEMLSSTLQRFAKWYDHVSKREQPATPVEADQA